MPLSYRKSDIEKVRSALADVKEMHNLQNKDFAEMFGITEPSFSAIWKPGGNEKTYRRLVNKLIQDYDQIHLSYIVSEKGFEVETIERFEDIEKEIQHLNDLIVENTKQIDELRRENNALKQTSANIEQSKEMIELSRDYLQTIQRMINQSKDT